MLKYIGFILTFMFASLFVYFANEEFYEANQESIEGRYIVDSHKRMSTSMTIGLMKNIKDPSLREVKVKEALALQKSMAQPAQPLDKKNYMIDHFINGIGSTAIFLLTLGMLISTFVYFSNIKEDSELDDIKLEA